MEEWIDGIESFEGIIWVDCPISAEE